MAYVTNISPGAPPLLWSNIDQAFRQINQNFTELQLYLNDSTITPIDLSNLYTDLSPGDSAQFSLGSLNKRWKSVFTSVVSSIPGNELNGLWVGNGHIKGFGSTINLPEGSTIGGDIESGAGVNLIIDPNKTFFKTLIVDSSSNIVAPDFNSTLNINSGNAILLSTDVNSQTITFNNTGVTSLSTGTGVSVDSSTGDLTITNTGVTSIGPVSTLPTGLVAGSGISVNSSTGSVTITNTGILSISGEFGITVSTDSTTGIATITNSAPAQFTFRDFVINGDANDPIQADSLTDTFLINSGYGINLIKDTIIDQLTIEWNQRSDLIGSVFADDSTKLVDAVEGKLVGEVDTLIGSIVNLESVNFGVETIYARNQFGVNIGAGGFNNLVVLENEVRTQNVPLIASAGIQGTLFGTVNGNVVGDVVGNISGDLIGSVFSDNSTMLIDGTEGKIVGPLLSSDTVNSIIMDPISGLQIVSTSLVDIQGAAGAQIGIGAGTSGDIYLGNGSNNIIIATGTNLLGNLTGNVNGNLVGDIVGSVFSDNSTMLLNGTDGSLMYYPSTPSDWNGTTPTTVGEAIDRLAAFIKTLGPGA